MYEGTWESVGAHRVPVWYEDAKLGVFIHWGLYSVPGWAPRVPDIQELLVKSGPTRMLRENPYAEWYLNTMQIKGSPTQLHHRGCTATTTPTTTSSRPSTTLRSVRTSMQSPTSAMPPGARYAVLTTKHHDGFALWPSAVPHPVKGEYHSRRDLVGDLSDAVRAKRIRMGLYYSGGYDWPYNDAVLSRAADAVLAVPHGPRYVEYVTAHWRELIERYQPSVLWNDISWPSGGNLAELFAYYYNTVEEGVVNDRWVEPNLPRNGFTDAAVRGVGSLMELLWPFIPDRRKRLTFSTPKHCDFRTPEYDVLHTVSQRKWELARGVGHSFGANRHEQADDIISDTDLIQMFCDVVSKNGNLLIGVGPRPDGTIPELQQAPLRGLGTWLAANGEAIYGSRPWVITESATAAGTPLRFTRSGEGVYVLVIGMPASRRITMPAVDGSRIRRVRLVGPDELLEFSVDNGELTVTLPDRLPLKAVTTLDIGSEVRARLALSR